MIPIRDENPTVRPPVITIVIIAANIAAWLLIQGAGGEATLVKSLCHYGLIPGELFSTVPKGTTIQVTANYGCILSGETGSSTLLTHAFLHGSWFHLIANMWFLWIFGDNVEDVMGSFRFVLFYLLCALAAAGAQIYSDPGSTIPMVGASGAIGGVMGAYARLYPSARVHTIIPIGFYITSFSVPAGFMLGYWFLIQLLSGIPTIGDEAGGVAFWAHAGGFVAGLILIKPMHRPDYLAEHNALMASRRPEDRF